MTIEEKREKIRLQCANQNCTDCPMHKVRKPNENCWSSGADIERNYAILFGSENKESDNVNHPKHYESGKYECIDVMVEAIGLEDTKGFCLCNAFKYIYRCTKKHETPDEDVKKAIWYLNKFLELEG